MLSPSSASSSLSQNLWDSALQSIKKNHPLFRPNFSSDDWIENHGVWSLSEAAITLAVAEYQNTIESHNAHLSGEITSGKKQIQTFQKELLTLVAWDKKKRGIITTEVGTLKLELKKTKSETVTQDLNNQIGTLEGQLTAMTNDREKKKTIDATIARLQQTEKELAEKQISAEQQASLSEDLAGALNDIQVTIPAKPVRPTPSPSHTPWLATTRGKVATIVVGLTAGTGLTWWNIHDQVSKGKEPVNLIERLMKGNNTIPEVLGTEDEHIPASLDSLTQQAILNMGGKIEVAKRKILEEISNDGNLHNLGARLQESIKKISPISARIVVEEKNTENGCPSFMIKYSEGNKSYIDVLGTAEIFNSIDNWITQTAIKEDIKSRLEPIMLATSMSNSPEQTRRIQIEAFAQSTLSDIFSESMAKNGFSFNLIESGIIWDKQTERPGLKIVYRFNKTFVNQLLIIPFSKLPN